MKIPNFLFLAVLLFQIILINKVNANHFSSSSNEVAFSEPTLAHKKATTQQQTSEKLSKKEKKKLKKQLRKAVRKALWQKITNRKKTLNSKEEKGNRIHWGAYASAFSSLTGVGIIIASLILRTAIFNILGPFAIVLLLFSVIMSIVSMIAMGNSQKDKYDKFNTNLIAGISGAVSLIVLLFIGFVVLAISSMTI